MDNQLNNLKNKLQLIRIRYEKKYPYPYTYKYLGMDLAHNYNSLLIGNFIEFDKPNKNGMVFKQDTKYNYYYNYKPLDIRHSGILV